MKRIIILSTLIFCLSVCKSQSQIINIENQTGELEGGVYYKDANNILGPFEGTYIFINGGTTLKIVLQKKIMSSRANYLNEDLLIGEYQYIENGQEKANTLDQLNINYANQRSHSIKGNNILIGTIFGCTDCDANEKRVVVSLTEASTQNFALVELRLITVAGQPALKAIVNWQARSYNIENQAPPPLASFPGGEYILLKQ